MPPPTPASSDAHDKGSALGKGSKPGPSSALQPVAEHAAAAAAAATRAVTPVLTAAVRHTLPSVSRAASALVGQARGPATPVANASVALVSTTWKWTNESDWPNPDPNAAAAEICHKGECNLERHWVVLCVFAAVLLPIIVIACCSLCWVNDPRNKKKAMMASPFS